MMHCHWALPLETALGMSTHELRGTQQVVFSCFLSTRLVNACTVVHRKERGVMYCYVFLTGRFFFHSKRGMVSQEWWFTTGFVTNNSRAGCLDATSDVGRLHTTSDFKVGWKNLFDGTNDVGCLYVKSAVACVHATSVLFCVVEILRHIYMHNEITCGI